LSLVTFLSAGKNIENHLPGKINLDYSTDFFNISFQGISVPY